MNKTYNFGIWVNGEWKDTEEKIAIHHKFTGELLGYVGKPTKEETMEAVSVCKETYRNKKLFPNERAEILTKAAYLIGENKDELALLLTRETGNTIRESQKEVERAIFSLSAYSEEAKRIVGEMLPIEAMKGHEHRFGYTMRVPVGVVCAITPFNGPLNLATHKVAAAIASGNTVVLKPAPTTPLSSARFAEILKEAGLPDGFLNVVFGDEDVGTWLLHDERINFYTFTGSPQVGEYIKRETGLRRVGLELGSNSATIVCSDADVKKAADLCTRRAIWKAGQVCISVQRVYVHKEILEDFLEEAKEVVHSIKVGNPEDPGVDVGPMHTIEAAERADSWVKEAVAGGARVVTGRKREDRLFYPTILTDVTPDMKVVCKEIFAPVLNIIPFSDLEEVVEWVNDSEYGLQAGVFTNDINTAFDLSKRIEVGGININDTSNYRADIIPYGGIKKSGIGREGPKYSIEEMTEIRVVTFNLQ